ncbi:MAG: sugar phosphate isomerase/epimerase family protein [Opitutales bacterium]
MKLEQVALQLYTIRDFTKTPEALAESLKKVADIGYQAVQVSAVGPIENEALVQLCADNGLTLCATHESGQEILDNPEAVAAKLNALGCKYTAYPYPGGVNFSSEASVNDLIAKLNAAGKVLHEAGCTLLYHNHQIEFRKLVGQVILERIYAETDPQYLQGETDTYWIQYGGGNPVAWCQRLKGRQPVIHLKDYRINDDNGIEFSEVGAGVLPFAEIIREAEAGGCEWFVVEQDQCPGDPFDSARQSFDYIAANLVN